MFKYFVYRRHGSISIMLSFLLIAILSLSSTLMETARYRSTQRLLNELEQNAAFSLLGYYDRDLYENFGLLAIERDAGKEELRQYLDQNLNGLGSGMDLNGLDKMLTIDTVDVDKLYDLTQNEVLRAQIMEFSAYRAPVTLTSNLLNLEDLMEELTDKLEEVLPFYETLHKLAGCMEKIIDTFSKLDELIEATKVFQKDIENYQKAVGDFNDAIDARDSYIEDHTSDEEGYSDRLASLNGDIRDCASTLQSKIETAKTSMGVYYDKYTEFKGAYDSMLSAEVGTLISAANNDADAISDDDIKKNTKEMLKDFKSGYDDSEGLCNKIVHEIDSVYSGFVSACQESLTEQYEELEGAPEDMSTISMVETLSKEAGTIIIISIILEQVKVFTQMVSGWKDAISKISDIIKVMKIMQTGGWYEPEYNNIIGASTWNSLPGVSNGGRLAGIANPFETEDEKMVSDQLADTAEVAASLDYDIAFLEPGAGPVEEAALQIAMEEMQEAADAFQGKCEDLDNAQTIFSILKALAGIVGTLIHFLDRVINLIKVFVECVTSNFTRTFYQKMWEAVYANEMFSNRTTTGDDSKLNGSDFPDYSSVMVSDECFDMANAEYILGGTQSERLNQGFAFTLILAMRVLCNIPAVLADKTLTELVGELCAIPIVGWIAAIIVVCAMIFLEAWADMIFMIYTETGVDVIKTQGYFTLDGSGMDDVLEKMEELLSTFEIGGSSESGNGGSADSGDAGSGSGNGGSTGSGSRNGGSVGSGSGNGGSAGTGSGNGGSAGSGSGSGGSAGTGSGNGGSAGSGSGSGGSAGTGSGNGGSAESEKNNFVQEYAKSLMQWNYKDHMQIMLLLFVPNEILNARCADLIEMQMRQIKKMNGDINTFHLNEMATYVRVHVKANYKPVLPIPSIPGFNDQGLSMEALHYSGY